MTLVATRIHDFDDVHVDADLDIELKPNQPDPLHVCTHCLAEILTDHLDRWRRQHPIETGREGDTYAEGRLAPGARADVAILAAQSGVAATNITDILRHKKPTVPLRLTDKLLTAIGEPWHIHDGEKLAPFRRRNWKTYDTPDPGSHIDA
jgi:hypothetical protein